MVSDGLTQIFTIRLSDQDRAALERAAQADDRPVTAMARKIIIDWLRLHTKPAKEQRR